MQILPRRGERDQVRGQMTRIIGTVARAGATDLLICRRKEFLLEREGSKPPRSQAVDFPRNAVLDQFCGFKDSEKIRFSGFIQTLVG